MAWRAKENLSGSSLEILLFRCSCRIKYINIYIYIHTYIHIYTYLYIYILYTYLSIIPSELGDFKGPWSLDSFFCVWSFHSMPAKLKSPEVLLDALWPSTQSLWPSLGEGLPSIPSVVAKQGYMAENHSTTYTEFGFWGSLYTLVYTRLIITDGCKTFPWISWPLFTFEAIV